MEDILFDEINLMEDVIEDIDSYEKHYDVFEVTCKINGRYYRVCDTRVSKCDSELVFVDTAHERNHALWILKKLNGGKPLMVKEHWNHNPNTWDDVEDTGNYIEDFDGYYGDGLDGFDELNYFP